MKASVVNFTMELWRMMCFPFPTIMCQCNPVMNSVAIFICFHQVRMGGCNVVRCSSVLT